MRIIADDGDVYRRRVGDGRNFPAFPKILTANKRQQQDEERQHNGIPDAFLPYHADMITYNGAGVKFPHFPGYLPKQRYDTCLFMD